MGSSKLVAEESYGRPFRPLDRERIIANSLVDVASELRLTYVVEFLKMIHSDHAANIADLVNSSSELFFKSGTLRDTP